MCQFLILNVITVLIHTSYSEAESSAEERPVRSADGWGPWTDWVCSATCGGGGGRKTRVCANPGPNKCPGGKTRYGKCNEQPCPVVPKPLNNKGWTPWMPWECPVTCGGGKGTRSRICEDPDFCEGPEEETGPCAKDTCPVDPDALNDELEKQIKEQMKTTKHSIVVKQGESMSLICKDRMASMLDREYPDAKVTWVQNGELVNVDDKRIKLEANGDLKVKAAVEDNGLWWCSVSLTSKVAATLSFASVGVQNEKPDITVEKGEKFELKCRAKSLGRLVRTRVDQKWIHNATTYKEHKNVKPEDTETFKIPSSNYSHSGVWNCRYTERGFNLPSPPREWVTSVFRVLVIPPRTPLQKLVPFIVSIIVILVLIGAGGWLYWKRIKMKQMAEEEEEEEELDYAQDWDDYDY